MELKDILNELGLSSYRIDAYLAILKIRSGTIQQIAKNSDVPACKLYETLKWLHKKGYISLVLEKPLTYVANDPKVILNDELSKRETQLNDIKNELDQLDICIPESEKDLIQITNSREGFIKKMKECLSNSKKSVSYIVDNWTTDSELLELSKRKIKQGVWIRALGPINSKAKFSAKLGIKVKNFDPETTRFSIFDKKISIIKLRKEKQDPVSIWIKSEVLAEILQKYFDVIWDNGKVR